MRSWVPALTIADLPGPLPQRIARAVVEEVRRGRLRPGAALPSSRALAEMLGVHRNTVVAAYAELHAEGWVETRPQRGTFVSAALPETRGRPFTRAPDGPPPARAGFDLPPPPEPWVSGAGRVERPSANGLPTDAPYPLLGGRPDLSLVPVVELARALRRALVARRGRALLAYGDPQGLPRLRAALAEMLRATRAVPVEPERVLVTRGSQMAVALAAEVLLRPGDAVAVEALGYAPAWAALRRAGARLVPIPVDRDGLDVAALERAAAREPVKMVYVTPHHQFPTTATLSAARRLRLLALARARRFAILEDDYDHEFHYEGRPILPLASADGHGVVLYVGTLSKILAPGLRVGWLVGPEEVVARAAALRRVYDRQGDLLVEDALAALLEEGEVERHARRARRLYRARKSALLDALAAELGSVLSPAPAGGGMAVWAHAPGVDVDGWAARAATRGVLVQPARLFTFDGRPRPFLRLGFATLDEARLDEAVRRLARAL